MSQTRVLLDSLTSVIGTFLGASYQQLDHVLDVDQNKNTKSKKGFGLTAGQVEEISGSTRAQTFDQRFELTLTESFVLKQDDQNARNTGADLIDKAKSVYAQVQREKAGEPGIVLNVKSFSADEPTFNNNSKVATVRSQFTITYRQT